MSDQGEKTCPLCAEEMDLTDQQLKPCRCGYEICVWCWHHIMEMAEKDESEGRCPACRTPYDKDRIVGMAENCERVVAEVNMEKKHKSQKAKIKTSESRKQLSSVRVIQRNLVYIVGLPLDLADEDLLQRKEYFGQYGKVLKVSISRTSAGTIQHFANNTCSVYITYGREDEAVRCIQSVHSFILDGRPLRACFGTTKYCHAWLRNVPCSNPDCLYLHEVGSQEDSFTKDEIISAYTRVQQITGVTNKMQQRAGNALPPPADDFCIDSSAVTGKPIVKSSTNNSTNSTRSSPPTSSSGRSGGLPPAASWGARTSNCNSAAGSATSSNGQTKQKAGTMHGPPNVMSAVSAGAQTSTSQNDVGKRQLSYEEPHTKQNKNKLESLDKVKQHKAVDGHFNGSEIPSVPSRAVAAMSTGQPPCSLAADKNDMKGNMPLSTSMVEQPCRPPCENRERSFVADGNNHKLCADVSSMRIENQSNAVQSDVRPNGLSLDNFIAAQNQGLQWHDSEELLEHSALTALLSESVNASGEACNLRSDAQLPSVLQNLTSETEDDFDNQRLRDAIVSQVAVPASPPVDIISHLRVPIQPEADANCLDNYTVNPPIVNRISDEGSVRNFDGLSRNLPAASVASNGFLEHFASCASGQGNFLLNGVQGNHLGRFDGEQANNDTQSALDMGESNIISNILSLDLDPWDDSLTSPQNLAKLLGDSKQEGNIKLSSSWRSHVSNESRFSFARQEDCRSHLFDIEPALGDIGQTAKPSFGQGFGENRDPYLNRLGNGVGFAQRNMDPLDGLIGGHSAFQSNKLSVSRSHVSAPPGFAVPSRPPPPGFTSQERSDQSFDFLKSGNQLHETSSFMRNTYQASHSGNINSLNDIEFIDPAILAVGKGRLPGGVNNSGVDFRSNFHVQGFGFENESKLQSLMQRSASSHQNLRYSEARDNLSLPNGAYDFTRHVGQSQTSNLSPFSQFSLQQPRNTAVSNGHWGGWSQTPAANDMGMADLLRNDRLGYNKLYGGYEDSKFCMTNAGDTYNRSFGM